MNTPATAFLAQQGVAYTEHEFEYVEHGGTAHSLRRRWACPSTRW